MSDSGGLGGSGSIYSGSEDDSIACKLAGLPAVHTPKSRTKSVYLQQFTQLLNDDPRRLKVPVQKRGNNRHIPSHVCVHCEELVYLTWKGTYLDSNKAASHLKECYEGGREAIEHKLVQQQLDNKVKLEKQVKMVEATSLHDGFAEKLKYEGSNATTGARSKIASIVKTLDNPFKVPSYKDMAYCSQLRFFLYSTTSNLFHVFKDPFFKNMLKSMIPYLPGYANIQQNNVPILTVDCLKDLIDAEFEFFINNLSVSLKEIL